LVEVIGFRIFGIGLFGDCFGGDVDVEFVFGEFVVGEFEFVGVVVDVGECDLCGFFYYVFELVGEYEVFFVWY